VVLIAGGCQSGAKSASHREFEPRQPVVLTGIEPVVVPAGPRQAAEQRNTARSAEPAWEPGPRVSGVALAGFAAEMADPQPDPLVTPAGCGQSAEIPCAPADACRFSLEEDLRCALPVLADDAIGTVNWNNAAILGVALAASIGIRQDLDDEIREATARHPERWGEASHELGYLGDPIVQIPCLLALYSYSLYGQDAETHDLSATLISAYTINGLATVAIKAIANTDRPSDTWNDGQFGFPSFHTSSTFAIAAVLDEYYGPRAGLPAYALAGFVGFSRIDERDHDLSDVVFGAALGYVIGKSVAGRHLTGDSRVHILPYVHPTDGTSGLALDFNF
jgi:hypothetical protein